MVSAVTVMELFAINDVDFVCSIRFVEKRDVVQVAVFC